jgi:hypothetical protein
MTDKEPPYCRAYSLLYLIVPAFYTFTVKKLYFVNHTWHTLNVLVMYVTELKIYATVGGLYNISYQINLRFTPYLRWPHHTCIASTLSSIAWLCTEFYFYCLFEKLVRYVVTRWHGMPCFTFRIQRCYTSRPCTIQMKLETMYVGVLSFPNSVVFHSIC